MNRRQDRKISYPLILRGDFSTASSTIPPHSDLPPPSPDPALNIPPPLQLCKCLQSTFLQIMINNRPYPRRAATTCRPRPCRIPHCCLQRMKRSSSIIFLLIPPSSLVFRNLLTLTQNGSTIGQSTASTAFQNVFHSPNGLYEQRHENPTNENTTSSSGQSSLLPTASMKSSQSFMMIHGNQ